MPFAAIVVTVAPGVMSRITPGSVWLLSIAAVAMDPAAVPGDPVMYGAGPLLPAEVTTETPAAAAFVDATADGSSERPKTEPSDMLMTSTSWSTAQSMASTVSFVEPWQPKTRMK